MSRRQILHRFQILGLFLLGAATVVSMTGCRFGSGENSDGIAWDGETLTTQREFPNPSSAQLHEEGFPANLLPSPKRFLSLQAPGLKGDLKLLEFPGENEAYGAFQEMAGSSELAKGCISRGDRAFFRKGRWLGMLKRDTGNGEDRFKSKLRLPSDKDWGDLPNGFSSLLHQGRFPESERILFQHFLGFPITHEVFAARFDCRGDSAWIYASPSMDISFAFLVGKRQGYHLDSSESDKTIIASLDSKVPLKLDFFESGMVGVEGCFDDSLTNYWLQTQKKVLKSLKLGVSN